MKKLLLAVLLVPGLEAAAGGHFQQMPGGFQYTRRVVATGPGSFSISGEGMKTSTKTSSSSGFLGFGKSQTEETKTKFGSDVLKEQKITGSGGKVEIKRLFNDVAIPSEGLVSVTGGKVFVGGREIDRTTGRFK